MKIYKYFFYILLLIFISSSSYAKTTIFIQNQKDFDLIEDRLVQCIKTGENKINVIILEGRYVAKEKHVALTNINAPKTKVLIKGCGAIIVPQGKDYRDGDLFKGTFSPYNSWMSGSSDVDVWSRVFYASGLIEVVDLSTKTCRLKSKEPLFTRFDMADAYILIPHGYQSSVYKIDKYENGYFYFVVPDLSKSAKSGYNVNDDYNYHKREIRYKLCNVLEDLLHVKNGHISLPAGVKIVREGKMQHYFYFKDCNFNSLVFDGLEIQGTQSNSFVSSRASLYFNNIKSNEIAIKNCIFSGMKINAISVLSTPNVHIENNAFKDCYYNAIESDNYSSNTIVKDNIFSRMGKRMQNTFCVISRGKDFMISNNSFYDYGYSAIGVGVWYKSNQNEPCCGIINNNTLEFSESYMSSIDNYGIMDSGAIYLWTKNDGVKILNNYISNYSGAGDNRGIFCDDGAYNFQIIGNVIIGITNSYCIDSRRVSSVEKTQSPSSGIIAANVNNVIQDNFIEGEIQFVGNETVVNGCAKGRNFLLSSGNKKKIKSNISCVDGIEDVIIESFSSGNNFWIVKPLDYKLLRQSPVWKQIKRIVKKGDDRL